MKMVQYPQLTPIFLQILKQKENFCLRERLSRDKWDGMTRDSWIKVCIAKARNVAILEVNNQKFDREFVLAINLVYIFSKFHPQYLTLQRNTQILDGLREKWINKVHPDIFLQSESRDLYMKIQKCLIIYCKNDIADNQILFDLLKEFSLSAISLDMRPLIELCTNEIPNRASTARKIKILDTALTKI